MKLPSLLLRREKNVYKNQFGHVLILAGSARMLGAAALTGLSAMRSGAGLATLGIPKSLNGAAQRKIAHILMTRPLSETREKTLSLASFKQIKNLYGSFNSLAIGPGLSRVTDTQRLVLKIIETSPVPLIIDADALNAISQHLSILCRTPTVKILTPHTGEFSQMIGKTTDFIKRNRVSATRDFAEKYRCTLLLKGPETLIISPGKREYINKTGNAGMATAGSGDVLTGMIAAFVAQGLDGFDAAKYGAYLHGKAGDLAAKSMTKLSMTASDIIDYIPKAVRSSQ